MDVYRRHSKTIARTTLGKTFVFWQPARKFLQSYHDYASFCPAKHDKYSVMSTEGGLNVNISHIVYRCIVAEYNHKVKSGHLYFTWLCLKTWKRQISRGDCILRQCKKEICQVIMPVSFFHRTQESTQETVLTHISERVKTKITSLFNWIRPFLIKKFQVRVFLWFRHFKSTLSVWTSKSADDTWVRVETWAVSSETATVLSTS